MALMRQSIPALYGGVSQQAASIRSAVQCERAVNCSFSIANGCSKRAPLECIAELQAGVWEDAFFFYATSADASRILIVLPGDGTAEAFRVSDGVKITMAGAETPQDYLTAPEGVRARDSFRAYTVGEETILVNTTVTVTMTAAVSAGSLSGTAQTLQDDVLNSATEGSIWKIIGDTTNQLDTYYAKKVAGSFVEWVAPGIPEEIDRTTMPHVLKLVLDEVDPLGIRAEYNDVDWMKRLVGDAKSNKQPSFVGKTLNGIFFVSDRLGFLAGQEMCISETGAHRNFWRTSVTNMLDSDRIDIRLASDDATSLCWAKPIGRSMIVFSEQRQFSIDWQGAMTPRTVAATQATAYPTNRLVEPLNAGPNLFFTVQSGNSTHLYEMFIEEQSVVTDAANVSSHAASFVPANITAMASTSGEDAVFLLSGNRIYAYQYHWRGSEKVQSAWSVWEFDVNILDIEVIGTHLYVTYRMYDMLELEDRTFLGRISLKTEEPGIGAPAFAHPVHLDQVVTAVPEYNEVEDRTYLSVPWSVAGRLESIVLVRGAGWDDNGSVLKFNHPVNWYMGGNTHTFYLPGRHDEGEMYVGLPYEQHFTFSEQFVDEDNRAQLSVRLQLRSMSVSFRNTGFFSTNVKVRGVPADVNSVVPTGTLVSAYAARTVGDEHFLLNTPQLASGVYRFPVLGKSSDTTISLTNDSYLPANFQTAEWEALVTSRTRR